MTNGSAGFQRWMDSFIEEYKLEGTSAFQDNITVGGMTQEEHDFIIFDFTLLSPSVKYV